MTQIAGRVAVVTGGASGIGRALATALTAKGATVVIADLQEGPLAAAAAELGIEGVPTDVSDPTSVQALADAVVARHGTVDIIINNAGIGGIGRIEDLGLADWKRLIDVDLWGVIHGVTSFLPILRANASGGHIVNTGSMSSFVADEGLGAYTVAKYGVAALTETLALELADTEIGVTLLAPGSVRSNFGRSPEEWVADADAAADVRPAESLAAQLGTISAVQAAETAIRAIEENALYAPTHAAWWPLIAPRFEAIRAGFDHVRELEES